MAKKAKRRGRRRVRRMKRNSWGNDARGHSIAAKLGWAFRKGRRSSGIKGGRRLRRGRRPSRRAARMYIRRAIGIGNLFGYRADHKPAARRRHRRIVFKSKIFGIRRRLVANKRRRLKRNGKGQFVGHKRRRSRRKYQDNWFVVNKKRRKSRRRRGSRRKYSANFYPYNDNPSKRRRSRRKYRDNGRRRRRYASNPGNLGGMLQRGMNAVKEVFDVNFLMQSVLPVSMGFFASRALVGGVQGLLGLHLDGPLKIVAKMVGAGLAGAVAGMLPIPWLQRSSHQIILGGLLDAANSLVSSLVKDVAIVKQSPLLSESFGVSGLGLGTNEEVRRAVEHEVMKELGVGDYLSAEQLGRSERLGTYLTAENMAVAERIGQYPRETSGMAQYPMETSGLMDVGTNMGEIGSYIG